MFFLIYEFNSRFPKWLEIIISVFSFMIFAILPYYFAGRKFLKYSDNKLLNVISVSLLAIVSITAAVYYLIFVEYTVFNSPLWVIILHMPYIHFTFIYEALLKLPWELWRHMSLILALFPSFFMWLGIAHQKGR